MSDETSRTSESEEQANENESLLNEMHSTCHDFVSWLGSLTQRRGGAVKMCAIQQSGDGYSVKVYTTTYSYGIRVVPPTEARPDGYLGAQAGTRKPRAGEEHTRGNDLHDGPYSRETFDAIIRDIVAYELQPLGS